MDSRASQQSRQTYFFILIYALYLTACVPSAGDGTINSTSSVSDGDVHIIGRVTVEKATYEDLESRVKECRGGKICVEICHRPPGNPENWKTKTLPLKATLAHMKHGGPEHLLKDYLGPCFGQEGNPNDEESDPSDDEDSDPSDSDDLDPHEVPPWCAMNITIDSDCDGYIDDSGEPLF